MDRRPSSHVHAASRPGSPRLHVPRRQCCRHDLGHRLWEGHSFMLHITCDVCGKELTQGDDDRYVVKVEVFAAHDPLAITEADLDEDHLEAVSQLLRAEEDTGLTDPDLAAPQYKNFRYDLCPECHKKFVRDPLGKEVA